MPTSAPAIGFVVVGMSNANQEWGRFTWRQVSSASHHPRLVLVDAGRGGYDAPDMDQSTDPYWAWFDQRLAAAGIGADQVQVVWLKQSLEGGGAAFPVGADALSQDLSEIVSVLVARCPNLRAVYLSSRIWGGGEPWNFETAFAVKKLVADQVDAVAAGTATGPWLAWGPYLWADGLNPRADGLIWDGPLHLEADNTHPSPAGEDQVADLLEAFLTAAADDPGPSDWYLPAPGAPAIVRAVTDDAYVDSAQPTASFGTDPLLAWATGTRIYLRFDLVGLPAVGIERARLSLRVAADDGIGAGMLYTAAHSAWSEGTVSFTTAPALAAMQRTAPSTSRGGIADLDVTAAVQAVLAAGGAAITLVLVPPATVAVPGAYHAHETGEGAQLLLSGPAIFADGFEVSNTSAWR